MTGRPLLFLAAWAICFPMLALAAEEPRSGEYGFIENKGQFYDQNYQANPTVKYLLKTPGMNVQLRNGGFSYDTYVIERPANQKERAQHMGKDVSDATIHFHRVDIMLEGANNNAKVVTGEPAADYINYFNAMGAFDQVHHFDKVTYQNIYNGIDLEFLTDKANGVKYNFIVHPGADVAQIKMKYAGANSVWLNDGRINLALAHGAMQEHIPASYTAATHKAVHVSYREAGNNTFGYEAGSYDKAQTLIIDPTPDLAWGSYYGGTGDEYGRQVAVNGTAVYVAGYTTSTGAIATTGSYKSTNSGNTDAFIAKFTTSGSRIWGTYYGGTQFDGIAGLAVSPSGNDIVVTGQTSTTGAGIATTGSHQSSHGGGASPFDGFVAKFTSGGSLTWGTYYGGTGIDYLMGAAIDGSGNIYAVGTTASTGTSIVPSTAFQSTYAGGAADGILIKFNSGGVRQWATYTGTDGGDEGNCVAVDGSGGVFMCGYTTNPTTGYIVSAGAHQTAYGGGTSDYFIGKFDGATGGRYWGTLYGGMGNESQWEGRRLAVDLSGNVIMVGGTTSANGIATPVVHQSSLANYTEDGMIVKFNTNGVRQWGTYYGSFMPDLLTGVVTDAAGNIYVAGVSESYTDFSDATSFQQASNGGLEAFYSKFNSTGNIAIYSTYFGDSGDEYVYSLDIDAGRHIYATGATEGGSNGMSTTGSHQASYGGGLTDVFIARINACETGSLNVSFTVTDASCSGKSDGAITVNVSNGTAPYRYAIGSGNLQSSNNFTGLSQGSYLFYVKDDNGCENGTAIAATVNAPPTPTKPVISGLLNPDNGNLESYSTPAQTGVTFTWIPSGGTVQTGQGTNQAIVKWTTSGAQTLKVVAGTSACGDSATTPINVKPVSVDNVLRENGVAVYPNPATNMVHITLDRMPAPGEEIRVYNAVGKMVLQQPLHKEQTVNISQLAAGVYNISVGGWRGKITKL